MVKACEEARLDIRDKTFEQFFNTNYRGDWFLWLFRNVNPYDIKPFILASGHCANTIRHLMTDERSIKAVDAAIAFGEDKITIEELYNYFIDANNAYMENSEIPDNSFNASVASVASAATYPHNYINLDSKYNVCGDINLHNTAALTAHSLQFMENGFELVKENKRLTADICRQYLPMEIWTINN